MRCGANSYPGEYLASRRARANSHSASVGNAFPAQTAYAFASCSDVHDGMTVPTDDVALRSLGMFPARAGT